MKTFTIENETNNIIAHATKTDAAAVSNAESFSSAAELADLAATWPIPRLIEIWNSIPGNTQVKKFTDRKTATTRIWKAIQSLGESIPAVAATNAEPLTHEASEAGAAPGPEPEPTLEQPEPGVADEEVASTANGEVQAEPAAGEVEANVGAQSPDVAPEDAKATVKATRQKKMPTGETNPKPAREGSKTTIILELLKREGGASLNAIMEATGWQAHSVRGFVAGTLRTKMKLNVVSAKNESGARTYSISS